ncbi:hypothetical protein JCM8208_004898 [Rhodotorula glutinis]
MSDQDAEPPRVGLMSLPKDILKLLVVQVAAQDEAIRESGIPLAASPASPTRRAGARTKLPGGKWAFEYGHGVGSLSLVNKPLRVLALPLLVQTVKASQLTKPLLEFRQIEPALLAGIKSLDLCDADADSFAAAALALDALPSLRELRVRENMFDTLARGDRGEAGMLFADKVERRKLAVKAFRARANDIRHLVLEDVSPYGTGRVSNFGQFLVWPTLRRLVLPTTGDGFVGHAGGSLPDALQQLSGLEALSLRGSCEFFKEALSSASWKGTQLATLQELTLHADEAAVFAFAAHLAPRVESLKIILLPHTMLKPAEHPVLFPSLRHLHLTGPPLCGAALAHVDLSSLLSLDMRIDSSPMAKIAGAELVPPDLVFPKGMRLDLYLHVLLAVDDYNVLMDRLVAAGVNFVPRPDIEYLASYSPRSDVTVKEPEEETNAERYVAVVDTLDWLGRRVHQLHAQGDVEGMQEMAEAVRKVAERKMLERL